MKNNKYNIINQIMKLSTLILLLITITIKSVLIIFCSLLIIKKSKIISKKIFVNIYLYYFMHKKPINIAICENNIK